MAISTALISTYDKTGIDELGMALAKAGIRLYSTGGTAKFLQSHNIAVHEVTTLTGFPELLGGRVKTLHPHIFAGILARRRMQFDMDELASRELPTVDLVVVNLYPFRDVVRDPSCSLEDALENIDIGGVALLRAAAKNFPSVLVLSSPEQYSEFVERLANNQLDDDYRRSLSLAAFTHTQDYDLAISNWLRGGPQLDAETVAPIYKKSSELRYGENPHQQASLFVPYGEVPRGIPAARKLNGREISYNNYLDLEAAWKLCREFEKPAAVVVKHNNPCGVALGSDLAEAFRRAWQADSMSAYGGIVAVNRPVDSATAEEILVKGTFFEAMVAPAYSPEALLELKTRKSWCDRFIILELRNFLEGLPGYELRYMVGGLLVQATDLGLWNEDEVKVVSKAQPTAAMMAEMRFAYMVAKYVRSNAIVITKDYATLGIGMGQPNRVWSVERALAGAGEQAKGAVLASDGFFPMPDAPAMALTAGITGIVQPGGSKADEKVIEEVDRAGAVMVFTGQRHFRH
jgi:phosphoribosylaminoimidazolecarboxamide formyltransferase/IMP cyclohydrolase